MGKAKKKLKREEEEEEEEADTSSGEESKELQLIADDLNRDKGMRMAIGL